MSMGRRRTNTLPLGQIRVTIGNEKATFVLRKEFLIDRDEAIRHVQKMRLAWIASLQGESPEGPVGPVRSAIGIANDERVESSLPPICIESVFQATEEHPVFDEWMETMDQ